MHCSRWPRERNLDEISVADVADRATVNRSTFYQHYPDTDTLLADALDAQAALVGADLTQIHPDAASGTAPDVLVRYATHVAENVGLYRSALGEHGSPVAVDPAAPAHRRARARRPRAARRAPGARRPAPADRRRRAGRIGHRGARGVAGARPAAAGGGRRLLGLVGRERLAPQD